MCLIRILCANTAANLAVLAENLAVSAPKSALYAFYVQTRQNGLGREPGSKADRTCEPHAVRDDEPAAAKGFKFCKGFFKRLSAKGFVISSSAEIRQDHLI